MGTCIQGYVGAIIAWVVAMLVMMCGWIIMLLVDVLIGFMQYNDFGNAAVVKAGWVLIRDVANMFFIVIILISAFATIVPYGWASEFHYTKVLPKLLLMAVLINFSRTLVLLMVDFSQVVMLTFVNAFKDAAAGNFVNALGLTQFLNIANTTAPGNAVQGISMINVIVSYILALILCIITIGVIAIMVVFSIYRIVAIWMALIASPAAFFVAGMPSKVKDKLGAFGGKYWNSLSELLTGGPVMAFFLWLTLSTVQLANSTGGLNQGLTTGSQGAGSNGFLGGIGQTQGLATFIVGIAMMMMGLQAAMQAASAVAAGDLAGAIGGFTKNLVRGVAKSPYRLGRGAASLGKRAAVGTYNAADRRFNITGGLSHAALKTVGRVPIVSGMVRPSLVQGMGRVEGMRKAERTEMMKGTENLSASEMQTLANVTGGTLSGSLFKTDAEKDAAAGIAAQALTPDARRKRQAELTEQYKRGSLRQPKLTDDEAKAKAAFTAEKEARDAGLVAEKMYNAQRKVNVAGKKQIEDAREASPELNGDWDDMVKAARGMDTEALKKVSKNGAGSGMFLTAVAAAKGGVKFNKSNPDIIDSFDESKLGDLEGQLHGTEMGKSIGALKNYLKNGGTAAKTRTGLQGLVSQGVKGDNSRMHIGATGAIDYPAVEKTSREGYQSGTRAPSVANLAADMLDHGMSAKGIQGLVPDASKPAVAGSIASMLSNEVNIAKGATDKRGVDMALKVFDHVMKDISSFDLEDRAKMYAGIEGGDPAGAAQMFKDHIGKFNAAKLKGTVEMVKDLKHITELNSADVKAGKAVSPERQVAEKFFAELQAKFPKESRKVTTPTAAGGTIEVVIPGAPPALAAHLHPS